MSTLPPKKLTLHYMNIDFFGPQQANKKKI